MRNGAAAPREVLTTLRRQRAHVIFWSPRPPTNLTLQPHETTSGTRPLSLRPGPQPVAPVPEVDPDAPLVLSIQRGDLDAFRTLVERHERRVIGLVMRMLHCDRALAMDVTQEVFLRVYRGIPTLVLQARFTTWLHTVAMNYCIGEYRKTKALKRNRRTLSIDQPIAGTDDLTIEPKATTPGPSEAAHHKEIAVAVREAVNELPEEFRHAVLLRDLQGLSYEEIGEILGVPPGTVRSRIHRGRLLLQEKLAEFKP